MKFLNSFFKNLVIVDAISNHLEHVVTVSTSKSQLFFLSSALVGLQFAQNTTIHTRHWKPSTPIGPFK